MCNIMAILLRYFCNIKCYVGINCLMLWGNIKKIFHTYFIVVYPITSPLIVNSLITFFISFNYLFVILFALYTFLTARKNYLFTQSKISQKKNLHRMGIRTRVRRVTIIAIPITPRSPLKSCFLKLDRLLPH